MNKIFISGLTILAAAASYVRADNTTQGNELVISEANASCANDLEIPQRSNVVSTVRRRVVTQKLSNEQLIAAVKNLYGRVDLNATAVKNNKSELIEQLIEQATGVRLSGKALYARATTQIGPWQDVLKMAQVPVAEIVQKARAAGEIDKAKAAEFIRYLATKFPDLSYPVFHAQDKAVRVAMFDKYGQPLSAIRIINLGRAYWGGWPEALESLNVQRAERMSWDADRVVEVLRFIKANSRNLNNIRLKLSTKKMRGLMFSRFHHEISGASLLDAARRYHGDWYHALHAAGIKAKGVKISLRSDVVNWNADLVLNIIHFLSQKRVNLHWGPMVLRNADILDLTFKEFGRALTAHSIATAGRAFFGTWGNAIDAAHVPWAFGERIDDGQGAMETGRAVQQFGSGTDSDQKILTIVDTASFDPEEALIHKESELEVQATLDRATEDERDLAVAILDYLEDHDDLDNHRSVLKFLRESLQRDVQWAEVQRTLRSLSQYFERTPVD